MTPICVDVFTDLDTHVDRQLVELPVEPELWWEAAHTLARMPCWSTAFALDLIGCVDADAGWPFAVIGEAAGGRWMQLFGTRGSGYLVELGGVSADTNVMAVLGRPGNGGTQVRLGSGSDVVSCKLKQVLGVEDARAAFSAWVLGGVFPTGYEVERVSY